MDEYEAIPSRRKEMRNMDAVRPQIAWKDE